MKRLTIIAIVLVAALSSCTNVEPQRTSQEIQFLVARHSSATKADYADYKDSYQNVPFGTYAWYKGVDEADNTVYFANKPVGYDEPNNRWITMGTTYYWPGTGTLDFISYSPYSGNGTDAPAPVVTENSIAYSTPWNVDVHQNVDVMYADKAIGLGGNKNTFNHGYTGVPTLFRHALARLAFRIKTGILSLKTGEGTTRWEIDVTSLKLKDIFTTGTVTLNLNEEGEWVKPETNAWTPTQDITDRKVSLEGLSTLDLEGQTLADSFFVLPQTLENQYLEVVATIRTYRDPGDGTGEKLIVTEERVPGIASLKTEEVETWGMNQHITYIITINPMAEIESSLILFDPAVAGWDEIVAGTTLTF